MESQDARLIECLRLFEETGDLAVCLERYPDLSRELHEHSATAESLAGLQPPSPLPESANSSRRLLLASAASSPGAAPSIFSRRIAAVLAAGAALFVVGALGASAAPGSPLAQPVSVVLGTLGLGSDHGEEVKQNVHDAIDSTEPGPERGRAVSEAACEAAHNRENLPQGAQDAPGQVGQAPPDCSQIGAQSERPEQSQGSDSTNPMKA